MVSAPPKGDVCTDSVTCDAMCISRFAIFPPGIIKTNKNKTDEEIKEIHNELYYIVYNDNRVIVGDNNKIKDSTIASSIE